MHATPCPLCIQFNNDLKRLEIELQFLVEGMPLLVEDSVESQRVTGEFHRVEAALDRLEEAYDAHCNTSLEHRLENRAALN